MGKKLLFLLTIIGFILGGCSMSNGKTEQVQKGMEEYLKKTYDKEFVVGEPYLSGNEGFGYIYQTKAYPKGQPELEFFVEGDRSNTGVYIDGYLQVLWTYQGRHELEKALREVYGDNFIVDNYEFRYNQKKFKDLNYLEVIGKSNGNATIMISYNIFSDEFNKEIEAEKAYRIMKAFLLDYKINKYDFTVVNFKKAFRDEFEANGNNHGRDKDGQVKSFDMLHQEKTLINALLPYHLEETHPIVINNSKDLIKWYKY